MTTKFTTEFRQHAVKQALMRSPDIKLKSMAEDLNIGYSTLQKWIRLSKLNQLNHLNSSSAIAIPMTKEQRPSDWSNQDKLELLIKCGSLDDEAVSQVCREHGIYPHHLDEWKKELTTPKENRSDIPRLKRELKALKKELNRKDKALSETAALLVLQKKIKNLLNESEDE